ncbi:unnamed protein product [Phaeothamnion confervicola]
MSGRVAGGASAKCLVLASSCCSEPIQEHEQRRCRDLLAGKGIEYDEVDGADPANIDLRNELFSLSGHRGRYPQVFIEREGEREFVGLWSEVEALNECCALPTEFLAANPEIRTFDAVFANLLQKSLS